MISEIDKYLNNVGKIKSSKEARKYEFVRSVSFKELPKDCLLPVTLLSNLGFFYDPKVHSIRCCECNFNFKNLKISLVKQLVDYHYKFNEKCANIGNQKHLIKDMLVRESIELNAQQEQEKVQKQMTNKESRLESFEDIELKISNHKLVENGFYVDKSFTLTPSSPVKIKCAFCVYNCIMINNHYLNCKYEDPFEEHKTTSPNCLIVIELNKSSSMGRSETVSTAQSMSTRFEINEAVVNSRLDLPPIRKIMELGIKRNTLKSVIENKLKEDGKDYENILDLVKACEKHEENTKSSKEQLKKPMHNNGYGLINSVPEVFSATEKEETLSKRSIEISNNRDDIAQSTKKQKSDPFQTQDLKEEIEKVKKENQCVVCMDRMKRILCPPCQHLAVCIECSSTLTNCPTCGVKLQVN